MNDKEYYRRLEEAKKAAPELLRRAGVCLKIWSENQHLLTHEKDELQIMIGWVEKAQNGNELGELLDANKGLKTTLDGITLAIFHKTPGTFQAV